MSAPDLSGVSVAPSGFLLLWLLLVFVWIAISSSFAVESLATGVLLSAALAYFFSRRLKIWGTIRISPLRLLHFVLYTGVFLRDLVHANINMMRYVYAPRIRVEPGVIRVKTSLKSPVGRLALVNSVSLTPGSLVIDIEDDGLIVHCLDLTDADPAEVANAMVGPLEKHLESVFG